jgi:hypothetical protein
MYQPPAKKEAGRFAGGAQTKGTGQQAATAALNRERRTGAGDQSTTARRAAAAATARLGAQPLAALLLLAGTASLRRQWSLVDFHFHAAMQSKIGDLMPSSVLFQALYSPNAVESGKEFSLMGCANMPLPFARARLLATLPSELLLLTRPALRLRAARRARCGAASSRTSPSVACPAQWPRRAPRRSSA